MKSAVQKLGSRPVSSFLLDEKAQVGAMNPSTGMHKRDILAAFRHEQFVPYYQPKLSLQTGEPTGVEILGRWLHPDLGTLHPDSFIPLLEQFELIDELTECLLVQSLPLARELAAEGKDIGLALNVSALSLRNESLPNRITGAVKEFGISPDRLTIELTETMKPESGRAVVDSLTSLRLQGFHISIDDFGTGHSSLKQLCKFPFTELKIDRFFVTDAQSSPKILDTLESIVKLAKKLQLRTVAEGVETRAELVHLQSLGCDMAQGYFFAHPMSLEMVKPYLQQLSPVAPSYCAAL